MRVAHGNLIDDAHARETLAQLLAEDREDLIAPERRVPQIANRLFIQVGERRRQARGLGYMPAERPHHFINRFLHDVGASVHVCSPGRCITVTGNTRAKRYPLPITYFITLL